MMRTTWGTFVLAALLLTTACAGLPTTSRTGAVHDVFINEETVSP